MHWRLVFSAILIAAIVLPFVFGVSAMGGHTDNAQAVTPCESAVHCHTPAAQTETAAPCVTHCFISGKQAVLSPTTFFQLLTIVATTLLAMFVAPLLVHIPYRMELIPVPKRYAELLSVRKRE